MAERLARWMARLAALTHLRQRCRASGWGLHSSCADGRGRAVCPYCEQTVGTRADSVGNVPVLRIKVHASGAVS